MMNRSSTIVAAALVLASVLLSAHANALEVKEQKARIALDVPDDWKVDDGTEFVLAYPDKNFHLRVAGIGNGYTDETQAETALLGFLNHHLNKVEVTTHGRRIDWNGYAGFESFGNGEEHSGTPAKWFAIVLNDKSDPSHGIVVLGTGTRSGFAKYNATAYQALHHLRSF
jgi:hypothetical protein